jgi:hypothetical protein
MACRGVCCAATAATAIAAATAATAVTITDAATAPAAAALAAHLGFDFSRSAANFKSFASWRPSHHRQFQCPVNSNQARRPVSYN